MSNTIVINITILIVEILIIVICTTFLIKQTIHIIKIEKRTKMMDSFSNRVNEMSIEEMIEEFKKIDENDRLLNEYYFYTIAHQIYIRKEKRRK